METIIRKYFRHGTDMPVPIENVPNNSVYSFESDGEKYIFKLFRSRYWPENDKLQFVNRTLRQHNIPCAELIVFTRDDPAYPNGYLIERKLDGITADKVTFTQEEETAFYRKLAGIVSEFHSIPVKEFGYLGGGEESMSAFFDDEFDERVESLEEKGVYTADELRNMKDILMNTLNRVFKRVMQDKEVTQYFLRHTFATRAIECGMDAKSLSEILGHKNPTITLKRYVHSFMEHKKDFMNRLGKML